MKIEFTYFKEGINSVNGSIDDGRFTFVAKLFDEPSIPFGINQGRVSTLEIKNEAGAHIVVYDRNDWEIPVDDGYRDVYDAVLDFLENAPKTRFQQSNDAESGIDPLSLKRLQEMRQLIKELEAQVYEATRKGDFDKAEKIVVDLKGKKSDLRAFEESLGC